MSFGLRRGKNKSNVVRAIVSFRNKEAIEIRSAKRLIWPQIKIRKHLQNTTHTLTFGGYSESSGEERSSDFIPGGKRGG